MTAVSILDVVAAVIREGDRILVCRRAPHIGQAGRWEFPGGKVEAGEDPVAALAREIREELDVGIRVTAHLSTDDTHVGDRIIRLSCYLATLSGSAPVGSTDHDLLRWMLPAEFDELTWAEPDLPAVRLLRAQYHANVPRYVITLVGQDRAGLVSTVAEVVGAHGGNWEGGELAERAGVFAGVVEVSVPEASAPALLAALGTLEDHVTVTVLGGAEGGRTRAAERNIEISLLANDRAGIVRDVSAVLAAHEVSIDDLSTDVRDAPMAGGRVFEASARAHAAAGTDLAALRTDLERLATELQVEITLVDR